MKYVFLVFLLLSLSVLRAQVSGRVTNAQHEALPAVSVLIKNSYVGTSTNVNGDFVLTNVPKGKSILIFKSLGYKSASVAIDFAGAPLRVDVTLQTDEHTLDEIVVTSRGNPALRFIKEAIAKREENGSKVDKFQADFYSKGLMRVKNLPKKMAKAAADNLPGLDSTGSGIVYLSETVSKISFQKPNKLYEEVVASKVSGDDKGFSFNTAIGANFDFYENSVGMVGGGVVSPIAYNALSYYDYKLIDTHLEDGQQIFKISVLPKRDKEPVVDGFIYIVDESWEIYAVDFRMPGYRTQQPVLDSLSLLQHYAWNATDRRWTKSLQQIGIQLSFFGIKAGGSYMQNFTNYRFVDQFPKGTFGSTLTKVNKGSNLMDSLYWQLMRPVSLTSEEQRDYTFKDSVMAIRNSKPYLDSVDRANNKFRPLAPIMGYSYQNSYRNYKLEYLGLGNLTKTSFNAVQGFTFMASANALIGKAETGPYTRLNNDLQYAFSERKLRFYADYQHRFNTSNYATLALEFGNRAVPFNEGVGIMPLLNTISSLFFKDSYIQLYQREQVKLTYQQYISTPLHLTLSSALARRSPLSNHSNYSFLRKDSPYASNNPILPWDYATPAFNSNDILEVGASLRWSIGQKSVDRPDAKLLLRDMRYPTITLGYTHAFNLSDAAMSYQHAALSVSQSKQWGQLGLMRARLHTGKIFRSGAIPFTDYQHFAGNQTHVGSTASYDNNFLLLPYYARSTAHSYLQLHAEHDFKGFLFNKIPVLDELQWGLIAGYHLLSTHERLPYHEFSVGIDNIGWGKYRLFRVDYVRSLSGVAQQEGIVVGLKFLNIFN